MKGKLFFSALLAGGMFLAGKAQAQDEYAYRPVAQIDSKCAYTRSDNYKNQFRTYRWEKDVAVRSAGAVTASRNYKHQTGVQDRQYEKTASVLTERGIVPEIDYKHQINS
jgi:hypothetical protein